MGAGGAGGFHWVDLGYVHYKPLDTEPSTLSLIPWAGGTYSEPSPVPCPCTILWLSLMAWVTLGLEHSPGCPLCAHLS